MKKIKLIIFLATLGLLLVSCKRDITEPTINSNPSAPTLAAPSYTLPFTMANKDSLITFSWSAVDFGFASSTSYVVQVSSSSSFSSNVANLLTTQKLSGKVKVGDVNSAILAWNYPFGTPVTVYFRIATSVSSAVATIYSDIKSKSFTPYEDVPIYPMIYVPGAYQRPNNWTPGAADGRLYSYGSNSVYQNIIRIKDGTNATSEFKITPAANWDTDWGGTLTKTGDNYSGSLVVKGSNFSVTAGTYAITVDITALTITLTKTNDWGIIGDATPGGWGASTPMFYNGQRKMWEITTNLVAGAFKFRANDAWDLNYGDTGFDGTLNAGGDNIPITTAGSYLIRLDLAKLIYTLKQN